MVKGPQERIRLHLLADGDITQQQATRSFRTTRLAGIIHRLRRRGMVIVKDMIPQHRDDKEGNAAYARYRLYTTPYRNPGRGGRRAGSGRKKKVRI